MTETARAVMKIAARGRIQRAQPRLERFIEDMDFSSEVVEFVGVAG